MWAAGKAPSCPVRARPSTSRRLHFGLDPSGHLCCSAAPDQRFALPQACPCLALAVHSRVRAGRRLALAGGPEAGSSCEADFEQALRHASVTAAPL